MGRGSGTSVGAYKKQKGVRLEVSLAWKYLQVFLAAEPVDLDLGEDQSGDGYLGVTNPHSWDPQDPQPRVWRSLMCFLQGGCCSSSKPALDTPPPSRAYL